MVMPAAGFEDSLQSCPVKSTRTQAPTTTYDRARGATDGPEHFMRPPAIATRPLLTAPSKQVRRPPAFRPERAYFSIFLPPPTGESPGTLSKGTTGDEGRSSAFMR